MRYREDDISLLLPSFRRVVEEILVQLRARGFRPCLRDTYRTEDEAQANALKGTGIVDSMHCYGIAADVICDVHGWDCARHNCRFYENLGELVEDHGAVWGGRWARRDLPHFQGVPLRLQKTIRRIGKDPATAPQRDALVARFLSRKR